MESSPSNHHEYYDGHNEDDDDELRPRSSQRSNRQDQTPASALFGEKDASHNDRLLAQKKAEQDQSGDDNEAHQTDFEALFGSKESNRENAEHISEAHETAEQDEPPEVIEQLATLETDEQAEIIQGYINARNEAVGIELEQSEPGTPGYAAAHADQRFLETVAQTSLEEDIGHTLEQAVITVAAELGLSPGAVEQTGEHNIELPEQLPDDQYLIHDAYTMAAHESNSNAPGLAESSEAPNTGLISTETLDQSRTDDLVSPPYAAGSSGRIPPGPPAPPNEAFFNAPLLPPSPAQAFYSNRQPPKSSVVGNQHTQQPNPLPEGNSRQSHDFVQGFMIGGFVGYLVGRRRGRIKTEKNFQVVKDKLEQQVDSLQEAILQKELQVRTLAAQKAIAEQTHAHEPKAETVSAPINGAASSAESVGVTGGAIPAAAESAVLVSTAEQSKEKASAGRLEQHDSTKAAEQSETHSPSPIERQAKKTSITPKMIERMPLKQLLEVADTVVIDGLNLKALFQAGRIEEHAVRRVLAENIRSGHGERQLSIELAEAKKAGQISSESRPLRLNERRRGRQAADDSLSIGIEANNNLSGQSDSSTVRTQARFTPDQRFARPSLKYKPKRSRPSIVLSYTAVLLILLALVWFIFA